MTKRKVIELPLKTEERKQREYERFLVYELPTLEVNASIELSFYSAEGKTFEELRAIERKAFDQLAYVHSKLPPKEAERFIQKCLPWWKCMKALHAEMRELAIKDLEEQGIVVKRGAN